MNNRGDPGREPARWPDPKPTPTEQYPTRDRKAAATNRTFSCGRHAKSAAWQDGKSRLTSARNVFERNSAQEGALRRGDETPDAGHSQGSSSMFSFQKAKECAITYCWVVIPSP